MVQRVEGLSIDLDLNTAGLNRGLKGAKDQLKTVNSEMKSNMSAFDRGDRTIEKYEKRLQGLNKKLQAQERVTSEARKEYDRMVEANGKGSKEAEKAMREYNHQAAALNNLDRYVNNATDELHQMRQEQERANSSLAKLEKRVDKTADGFMNAGKALSTGITLPLSGAGLFMGNLADDFDRSAGRIEARLGVTAERAEELNDVAEELWVDAFGQDMNEVSETLSLIAQNMQDLSDVELKTVTKQAFILRDTFQYDFNESVRAARSLIENFGVDGTKAFDYLTRAAQEGGDFAQDLLDTISEYSVQFSDAGFSIDGMFNTLIQGAQNGAFNLDKVGDAVKEFQVRATDGTDATAEGFEAIGLEADDMAKKMAKGGDSAQDAFAVTVSALANMEDEVERNQAGVALFGTMWEDVREKVILSLDPATDMLGEVEGATEKAGDALYDNFGTHATAMWRDFQDDLEPAGEILLDLGEDILPSIADSVTDLTEAFADLSSETQENIVKIGGLVAVAGPAGFALVGVAKGATTLIGAGKGLFSLLGKARGVGLLGRIAGLGLSGPVGWGIAGLGALGATVGYLTKDKEKLNEVSLETVEKMQKEINKTDNLIAQFEELEEKNKLTKDEMLRYMDVLDDLSSTSAPDKVKDLKDEQQRLLKKSEMTNGEMEEFLGLNDKIIEKAPNTAKAISEEGNAYADNLKALKELNAEKRKEMLAEAETELLEGLRNEKALLEAQTELENELTIAKQKRGTFQEKYNGLLTKSTEYQNRENTLNQELQSLLNQGYDKQSKIVQEKVKEIARTKDNILANEKELEQAEEKLSDQKSLVDGKEDELQKTNSQLKKMDNLKYKYEALILSELDLNAEKGQGIIAVNRELLALDKKEQKLEEHLRTGQLTNQQYREGKDEISKQRSRLRDAKGELQEINRLAAETTYEKDLYFRTHPSISSINREIAADVTKRVNLSYNAPDPGYQRLAYAEGTSFHPGGEFLAGEKGIEIGMMGNKAELLGLGIYNRPAGYKVFPHDESMKILSAINNIPGYATGARTDTDLNRVMNNITGQQLQGEATVFVNVVNEMDGEELSRRTYKTTAEFIERDQERGEQFAG
ncbi:hypothetical protein CEY16_05400 [Halalkalibacillus sediminis]|uniref:Phage tail tape measure protein domain-containing protein n=1 Tax=Halalkalibacillus sediminis TaxID=2018042 RepID=A0A2I0QXW6_9BACI|nr:phage tail tape measure protein [Halalkalibacillus sediminis]PKR79183.1 hypothetical protein CEY16_05400 [Halalkalibacillus sediminis]